MIVVNKKIKVIVITLLILLEVASTYLMYRSFNNRNVVLDNVKLKGTNKSNGLAIMIEQEDGSYKESASSSWPEDMNYNEEQSGCIDSNGKKIENSLTYEGGVATIKSNTTSYCYLYFYRGIKKGTIGYSINNVDNNNINYEAGLYRYQGTANNVNNNYICFGTSDKNSCVNNTDKYMYRIIGITNDGQLKLLKKEALNTTYYLHNIANADVSWSNSDLYKGLNGKSGGTYTNLFVNNSYYKYMLTSSEWYNKISNVEWKYGKIADNNKLPLEIYNIEDSFEDSIYGKIGLMHMTDYYYGISGGNTCTMSGSYTNCKGSWIPISHNDTASLSTSSIAAPSNLEWIITNYGGSGSNYYNYRITTLGQVNKALLTELQSVRPVMYIKANEVLKGGIGTSTDPYLIEGNEVLNAGEKLIESEPANLNVSLQGGLYRYQGTTANVKNNYICFGTYDSSTCKENPNLYMYRIIGINESGQLKLIKNTGIGQYQWMNNDTAAVTWLTSYIYKGLNGMAVEGNNYHSAIFVNNLNYPYMSATSEWYNKIATTSWKYGDVSAVNVSAENIYNVEKTFSANIAAKIGLMYIHDFVYGLSGGNNCSYSGAYTTCATSWIYWQSEWTMSRMGQSGSYYYGWIIANTGFVSTTNTHGSMNIRPVFYLIPNITLSGNGTETNPFIVN